MKKNKIVTIIGPYRYHNFGDDLIGSIMVLYLRKNGYKILLPNLSENNCRWLNIEYTTSIFGALKKADKIIIGGGGILGDSGVKPDNYYLKLALKTAIYSKITGKKVIVNPVGAGPLKLFSSKIITLVLGKLVSRIGVRDKKSEKFLIQLGIDKKKIICGADTVFLLPKIIKLRKQKKRKYGIQFDIDAYVNKKNSVYENYKNIIKNFVKKRINNYMLITNGNYSSQLYSLDLRDMEELKYSFLPSFLNKIISLKAILTTHLHLSVIAYTLKIPCFSIYVREKTKRFYKLIGHPERAISLYNSTEKDLKLFLNELIKVKWTDFDEKKLKELKKEALKLVDFEHLFS